MKDKLKHFLACAAIAAITLAVLLLIGTNWAGYEKLVAVTVGTLAAIAKEIIWDKWLKKRTPDFYDFVAGLIGAFVGTFIWIIADMII
jgi:VanZ family protein